jgi:teichuronopeptide biosynthesis TupA-like protein
VRVPDSRLPWLKSARCVPTLLCGDGDLISILGPPDNPCSPSRFSPYFTHDTKNKLNHYASSIGREFRFVRVDFLVSGNQEIYLGELTFCPTNALNSFSNERQIYLGSLWSQ